MMRIPQKDDGNALERMFEYFLNDFVIISRGWQHLFFKLTRRF